MRIARRRTLPGVKSVASNRILVLCAKDCGITKGQTLQVARWKYMAPAVSPHSTSQIKLFWREFRAFSQLFYQKRIKAM